MLRATYSDLYDQLPMSEPEIHRFLDDMKNDEALRGEVMADMESFAAIVERAAAKGYDFTLEEAKSHMHKTAKQELSDEQLDAVAGGKSSIGDDISSVEYDIGSGIDTAAKDIDKASVEVEDVAKSVINKL